MEEEGGEKKRGMGDDVDCGTEMKIFKVSSIDIPQLATKCNNSRLYWEAHSTENQGYEAQNLFVPPWFVVNILFS